MYADLTRLRANIILSIKTRLSFALAFAPSFHFAPPQPAQPGTRTLGRIFPTFYPPLLPVRNRSAPLPVTRPQIQLGIFVLPPPPPPLPPPPPPPPSTFPSAKRASKPQGLKNPNTQKPKDSNTQTLKTSKLRDSPPTSIICTSISISSAPCLPSLLPSLLPCFLHYFAPFLSLVR